MLADAHIHLADLLERDPGFPERLRGARFGDSPGESLDQPRSGWSWTCCAASHSAEEWAATEGLRSRLPPFVASFGIHPQWPVRDHAELLERLVAERRIAAIGEAGFDFFGDRPERTRNEANEAAQRAVFELQLELAEGSGLALLLHLRKAMDLAFEYAPRMKRLRAAVFHSFPGSAEDARSLLARGVNAYFSFGAPIVNGNKRAMAACAYVPEDRLLSETDAPWQPPRAAATGREKGVDREGDAAREGGAAGAQREAGAWCRAEDLELVTTGMAALRGTDQPSLKEALSRNFAAAYSTAGRAGEGSAD